jgi:Protein of unknown function (DUF1800)/Abnormal spindle-like microcephaly-assoc'd, ASPM-SPD-2-Hydin/IPT/TIG domain
LKLIIGQWRTTLCLGSNLFGALGLLVLPFAAGCGSGNQNHAGPTPQAAALMASVGTISFADTEVGFASASLLLSISNTGKEPSAALQTTIPDQFVANSNSCNAPLSPGQQCSISLAFTPSSRGQKTASLMVQSAQQRVAISLSGNAFVVLPTLSSTSPSVLQTGQKTTVILTGSNLDKLTQLLVNGAPTNFLSVSSTQIIFNLNVQPAATGMIQLVGVTTDDGGGESSPLSVPINISAVTYDAAVRFLQQASFGPTPASVTTIQTQGLGPWIDQQIKNPAFDYTAASAQGPGVFYSNTQNESLALRQRVGFALSQIFVTQGYGPDWENLLEKDCFGNAQTLLQDVATSPIMGEFLDNLDNFANLPYALPDQNFAREFLQVMTIGTTQLNAEGSQKVDAQGKPIPNYDQDNIAAMAAAFSGWRLDAASAAAPSLNPLSPMIPVDSWHDQGSKQILPGVLLPAGQGASQDMKTVLDTIFRHPSLPPFLCFRLIQHLVKSNPSPAYTQRMSMVFENDGTGTRGNLGALVKAILLDPEARAGDDPQVTDNSAGHYMEPILYISSVMKMIGGLYTDDQVRDIDSQMAQGLYSQPSVFSYYSPLHELADGTYAPETQLFDDAHGMTKIVILYNLLHTSVGGFWVDLSRCPFWNSASTDDLLDLMNHLLFHGEMSAGMRSALEDYISANSSQSRNDLLPDLLFMALQSSSYQVIR